MEALFGSSKTPAEKMKEYQRSMKKSIRGNGPRAHGPRAGEKKLMADIKKEAKAGRNDSAKIMARDLVRTRGYIKKMYKMKSHMEAISLRLTTMQSTQQMAQAMKGVTKVMGKMNAKMNMPQIQSIMMEFEKQNEVMGMKEEMMDDAMDDAFADDDDDEEEEKVLGAIFQELGIAELNKMGDAPTSQVESGTGAAEPGGMMAASGGDGGGGGGDDLDAELQKRLENLRRT